MFVGHALLAFALVGGYGAIRGRTLEQALLLGVLAAAFAAIPDVDMVYAPAGPLLARTTDPLALAETFWSTGNLVHRAMTHSLVVAPFVACAAALWVRGGAPGGTEDREGTEETENNATRNNAGSRVLSVALLVGLVVVANAVSGPLGGLVMGAMALAALLVAEGAARRDVTPVVVFATALFGLASHPFGDVFTGTPPALLYPFGTTVLTERVALSPDPTLHLLGAFGVELATVWAALGVYLWLRGVRPAVTAVTPRATLAAGYGVSVLLIPAPTLDVSYPFVFSVLAVGTLGALPRVRLVGVDGRGVVVPDRITALTAGLAAVTVAWLAYAVAYVYLG